jgi:hypothetical protein
MNAALRASAVKFRICFSTAVTKNAKLKNIHHPNSFLTFVRFVARRYL